jgi:16S rRNA (cytosine1402-N4)-methyltransferase
VTPRRRPGGGPESGVPGRHIPVLVSEVVRSLKPRDGATYIDGTFGAGGYAAALLEAADCRVIAFDRDPDAIKSGQTLADLYQPRLTLVERSFGDMAEAVAELDAGPVDGVVFDLGVSSMQLDEADRGFSFQSDGPLDMRMSRSGLSAADVVNTYEEEELANVIYELGEERKSRAIARAIVARRTGEPFMRTSDLAGLVSRVLGGRKDDARHPATRTFQALRMHVNDELGELTRGLGAAEEVLSPGGVLAVVTFHSLEDRIVKRFLKERSGKVANVSRYLPETTASAPDASFQIVNTSGLTPSRGEVDANPRARSARLRVAVRTAAPAWPRNM